MYIISIVDTWDDGASSTYVKITKREAVNSVADIMRTKHDKTTNTTKRVMCNNMIKMVLDGCMSYGIGSGKENTLAYDICDRDEWEKKKQEEINKTKQEIEDLQLFINKTRERLAQLDKMGHL